MFSDAIALTAEAGRLSRASFSKIILPAISSARTDPYRMFFFIEFSDKVSEGESESDPCESGSQCQIGVSRKSGGEILNKNIRG